MTDREPLEPLPDATVVVLASMDDQGLANMARQAVLELCLGQGATAHVGALNHIVEEAARRAVARLSPPGSDLGG